jgi:hypothetical protein
MADTLRIKRRPVGGAAGPPASLAAAELAYNEQDDKLYYGKGNSGGLATSIIAIGGPGAMGGGGGASITISDTPPGSPTAGAMWWESDTGTLWIYYDDGTSSQWVVAASGSAAPAAPAVAQNNLVNGKIVESHSGNAATFAVKTLAGGDPSASNPVSVAFTDSSILSITSALSLTVAAGVTLGTTTSIFRLWFAIINNSGTPLLAVKLCSLSGGNISNFDARGVASAVVPANNPYVLYAASAVTDMPYRVVAFADYETGNTTAGNWTVSPTRIMAVGPNTPMPGSVLSLFWGRDFGQSSTTSASFQGTSTSIQISITSKLNPVRLRLNTNVYIPTVSAPMFVIIARDSLAAKSPEQQYISGGSAANDFHCGIEWLDWPAIAVSKVYQTFIRNNDNASTVYLPGNAAGGYISAEELMG